MKIQLDIPEKINTDLKVIKAKNKFRSLQDLIIKILKDSSEMINETDEMINKTWKKIKSKIKKK